MTQFEKDMKPIDAAKAGDLESAIDARDTLQYVVTQARNYIIEDRKDDDLSREDINKYVVRALKASLLRSRHTNVIKNYFEQLVRDARRVLETEFSITVSDILYVIDNRL